MKARYPRVLVFFSLFLSWGMSAVAWQPAEVPLATPWTQQVSPENAWPEYPRPQMVRDKWTNLNGLWQYAIRPVADEKPKEWDGDILVPFAVESALSGVKKSVSPDERLWYQRKFSADSRPEGGRMLLHFGAVDWKCQVWVNSKEVGQHKGGYVPFSFDITDALKPGADNELVVAVTDPTDIGNQPRGKQVLKPHGIFYTAVTGIWQTVWLEPVPAAHIKSIKIVPDIDRKLVSVTVRTSQPGRVRILADAEGGAVAKNDGDSGEVVEVPVATAKLWSPGEPNLYSMKVQVIDGEKVVDTIDSYYGMRKIEVKKDDKGINRLWLNNKVVFQYGPLDQGWWPDGLYTPPTDDALKYDIEMTRRLGMNMIRKHVKVEPARWYNWCDKLGVVVWQDMPSGDVERTAESKADYRAELKEMIDALESYPSIVVWVPFNEGWGQYDTPEVAEWTKKYDPSRLVDESSGWHDKGSGDLTDMHNYPGPGMREPEEKRASVLGEFGGLGMPVKGHTWQEEKNWGYVSYENAKELTDAYVELLTAMRPLIGRGLCAAVYTQTTDVEIEVNGLMTYDRKQLKMDEARIVEAAHKLYSPPPVVNVLLPTSEQKPQTWHYTTTRPAKGWQRPKFNDKSWKTGPGGFGAGEVRDAVIRTPWKTDDIWLRRKFKVDKVPSGDLMLNILYDEDAEVYLNGQLASSFKGMRKSYRLVILSDDVRKLLKAGENTIAVHCLQTKGAQYIDAGMVESIEQKPKSK